MADRIKSCRACDGRGYFRCECWPGDCICGQDEETCWDCDGEGVIYSEYDDYPDEIDAPTVSEDTEASDNG